MHTQDHSAHESTRAQAGDRASRRAWWAFGGFAVFALILLAVEHRAHLLGWLPWLILLACLLIHRFMHGSHGRDVGDSPKGDGK